MTDGKIITLQIPEPAWNILKEQIEYGASQMNEPRIRNLIIDALAQVQQVDTKPISFGCVLCKDRFWTLGALETHIKNIHMLESKG